MIWFRCSVCLVGEERDGAVARVTVTGRVVCGCQVLGTDELNAYLNKYRLELDPHLEALVGRLVLIVWWRELVGVGCMGSSEGSVRTMVLLVGCFDVGVCGRCLVVIAGVVGLDL
jgi:hypothetical protein